MSKSRPASKDYVHDALAWLEAHAGGSASAGHRLAQQCLADMGAKTRGVFNRGVEAALAAPSLSERGFSFTVFSQPIITVVCWSNPRQRPAMPAIRHHVLSQMTRAGDAERPLMLMRLGEHGQIEQIHAEIVSVEDVPAEERTRLSAYAADAARKAVEVRIRDGGKIGRNEVCPCGSGKKYKQCCGLSPVRRR